MPLKAGWTMCRGESTICVKPSIFTAWKAKGLNAKGQLIPPPKRANALQLIVQSAHGTIRACSLRFMDNHQ
jgi:hypothetical protein